MTRPLTLAFLVPATLTLTAAGALPAFAGNDGPTATTNGGTTTIRVQERETSDQFAPKGEAPGDFPTEEDFAPKVGDAFVFTSDLFQGERKVGTDSGRCTATEVDLAAESITNFCKVTITFPGGTLVVEDTVVFSAEEAGDLDVALVSGTGAYRGAKGTVHVIEHDCDDDCELSISDLVISFTTDGSQVAKVPAGGAAAGGGFGSDSSDTALLGLAALASVAGLGAIAGGRRLASRRD